MYIFKLKPSEKAKGYCMYVFQQQLLLSCLLFVHSLGTNHRFMSRTLLKNSQKGSCRKDSKTTKNYVILRSCGDSVPRKHLVYSHKQLKDWTWKHSVKCNDIHDTG